MKSLTTSQLLRYILAAALVLSALGLMTNGYAITGVACLLGGVLCLPILYTWLRIRSVETEVLAPAVMLAVALFSYTVLSAIPSSFSVPLKTTYSPPASTTAVSKTHTDTAVTTTSVFVTSQTTAPMTTTSSTAPYMQDVVTADTIERPLTSSTVITTVSIPENTTATSIGAEVPSVAATTVVTVTTTAPTATQVQAVGDMVYRTPSGKRYHLSATCGGENSYEVTYDEAIGAGLTPCKKCTQ